MKKVKAPEKQDSKASGVGCINAEDVIGIRDPQYNDDLVQREALVHFTASGGLVAEASEQEHPVIVQAAHSRVAMSRRRIRKAFSQVR